MTLHAVSCSSWAMETGKLACSFCAHASLRRKPRTAVIWLPVSCLNYTVLSRLPTLGTQLCCQVGVVVSRVVCKKVAGGHLQAGWHYSKTTTETFDHVASAALRCPCHDLQQICVPPIFVEVLLTYSQADFVTCMRWSTVWYAFAMVAHLVISSIDSCFLLSPVF